MNYEDEAEKILTYIYKNYPSYIKEDDTVTDATIRVFEALEVELGKCLEESHDIADDDSK